MRNDLVGEELTRARERDAQDNASRRERRKQLLLDAKDHPCATCGVRLPAEVMVLAHRPGEERLFTVGTTALKSRGLQTLTDEIAKCEVLCPNCNATR